MTSMPLASVYLCVSLALTYSPFWPSFAETARSTPLPKGFVDGRFDFQVICCVTIPAKMKWRLHPPRWQVQSFGAGPS